MESRPNGRSNLSAMHRGWSGVGEWFGQNDDLRWQPSGVNQVERDRLLQAARSEHAEACGKSTAKGNPQGERGGIHQFGDISIYGQDKWARWQRPFGLATRARRVKSQEVSDPFWSAVAAGTKSRHRGKRWSQPPEPQQRKQSNPPSFSLFTSQRGQLFSSRPIPDMFQKVA